MTPPTDDQTNPIGGAVDPPVGEQPSEPGDGEPAGQPVRKKSELREWLETIVLALVVALLIRHFIVQVYRVEGESMEPTFHSEERVLVDKLSYRFRSPAPGEVVVLRDPADPRRELIKRVIALAGETLEVRQGQVFVNGNRIAESYKAPGAYDHGPVTIPEGTVFVMGDNRMASMDSRWMGPIPLKYIQGKAFFRFWPPPAFAVGPLTQDRALLP